MISNKINISQDKEQKTSIFYLCTFISFLLLNFFVMLIAYSIGIEPIYRHITPFYALWKPIHLSCFSSLQLPFFILVSTILIYYTNKLSYKTLIISILSVLYILFYFLHTKDFSIQFIYELIIFLTTISCLPYLTNICFNKKIERTKSILILLIGIYLFYIFLSFEVATIRGGIDAISQPYQRAKYEYIGDIGITKSIYELFNRYHEIQSYLSLHARLAPPGPLSLLWLSSYFVGKSPFSLSIFTVLFGGLAIFPLFLWIKELSNHQTKTAIEGTFLYTLIPSLVLFCATSTEILYMPFLFLSLWSFEKSLNSHSLFSIFFAGILFAILSLFKFTLLSIGIYFVFRGLLFLYERRMTFLRLFLLSLSMLIGFFLFYFILCFFTDYKPIQVFFQARKMFDEDMMALQSIAPRYSLGWFKLFTPWSWIYFTGIPIFFGFLVQIKTTKKHDLLEYFLFFATLLVLDIAYIAPGEGERSALYIFPFFLIPALRYWETKSKDNPNLMIIVSTFLIFQTVLTESLFYTYW